MKEEKIEVKINNAGKSVRIEIDRIFFIDKYQNRSTEKPTYNKIIALCHELKDSEKSQEEVARDDLLAEKVIAEIASNKKLFPQLGQDWQKRTVASGTVITIGEKSYWALEMMLYRLEGTLKRECNYDDGKIKKEAFERSKKMMQKALKRFDKRMIEAVSAFDNIFQK